MEIKKLQCKCGKIEIPEPEEVKFNILSVDACGHCYFELLEAKNRLVNENWLLIRQIDDLQKQLNLLNNDNGRQAGG